MRTGIPVSDIKLLVSRQIRNNFMLSRPEEELLEATVDIALRRCEFNFSRSRNKYCHQDGETFFNPFHSGQYTIFLYYLSNSVFALGKEHGTLADRIYYLNRMLNGVDLFYEVKLPEVFFLDHPLGSVMGRAVYGNNFFFSQNCTVGNNKSVYPVIGENVRMMSGSKIIGRVAIGDNVIISANTYIKDQDIPPCSLVFGASPDLTIVSKSPDYFQPGTLRQKAPAEPAGA